MYFSLLLWPAISLNASYWRFNCFNGKNDTAEFSHRYQLHQSIRRHNTKECGRSSDFLMQLLWLKNIEIVVPFWMWLCSMMESYNWPLVCTISQHGLFRLHTFVRGGIFFSFLDVIGTKVLGVFYLDIHSQKYREGGRKGVKADLMSLNRHLMEQGQPPCLSWL